MVYEFIPLIGGKKFMKKLNVTLFFSVVLLILGGCSEFTGIRQPLYDGQTVEENEEAIAVYHETGEIIGEEKEYYFRYPFSEDLYQPSLDYTEDAPVLLNDGEYIIGEDVPAGRVSLLGNESVFSSENYEAHVGNFIIYDEAGEVYFENMFHSLYGPLVAQVDFISGHRIEIIGADAEISAFYTNEFPEDPYLLMDPPQMLETLGRVEVQQPITVVEDTTTLTAGIYEVGVHLEAGTYEVTDFFAVHNTEMYVFHEGEEPRVFELIIDSATFEMVDEELVEVMDETSEENNIQIELQEGDKIYPNLVSALGLKRVE